MKSKEVLKLLHITRATLTKYVKNGTVKVKSKINKYHYEYDDNSVYSLINKNKERLNIIYARVSTNNQKNSLDEQIEQLNSYCLKNDIMVNKVYKDIASGMTLDRKGFNELLDLISTFEVENVFITYRDRLTRLSFNTLENIFSKYGTHIICLSEIDNSKTEEQELLDDIISLIHTFSMKNYSKRRKKKLSLIEEDLLLEKEV